ncbi:MAG TPA: DUF4054 domain-containing protein [Polyangia bacterium]|jgi:hypothetical protein|nr:DUF4054 domain-containing protein [Polyangia bacterium]
MSTPNFDLLTRGFWGSGEESVGGFAAGASGIVIGSNPPYSSADFLAFYPKFVGTVLIVAGTLTSGSVTVAGVTATGPALGQLVEGSGIPAGTTIISTNGTAHTITLSLPATASGACNMTVHLAPFIPPAVVNAYIALASASLAEGRWKDAWAVGMGLFVAHFLTLWLRSDGGVYATAGQAAASGLSYGILVSKSAGPVSASYQALQGIEQWAAWNLTTYGQQFSTMARTIGIGAMFCW